MRVLGCGTSSGVPRIGGDWGRCDPTEPRNRRTRASILVEAGATRILVDTGPDMRGQLLAAGVGNVDAVIWTHEHADHSHGIDDLRQIYHARGTPVPGYAREPTLKLLRARFAYVFAGRYGYPPTAAARLLNDENRIGDVAVRAVDMPHGEIFSSGLRFEHGGHAVGYATDFHTVTPEMEMLFDRLDLWIADALRHAPHPTHAHLALTLDAVGRLAPARTLLTHLDHSMDYASLRDALPDGVEPAYDGQEVLLG